MPKPPIKLKPGDPNIRRVLRDALAEIRAGNIATGAENLSVYELPPDDELSGDEILLKEEINRALESHWPRAFASLEPPGPSPPPPRTILENLPARINTKYHSGLGHIWDGTAKRIRNKIIEIAIAFGAGLFLTVILNWPWLGVAAILYGFYLMFPSEDDVMRSTMKKHMEWQADVEREVRREFPP